MNDVLLQTVLAFILGFVLAHAIPYRWKLAIRKTYHRLTLWANYRKPVYCKNCGKWVLYKDTRPAEHRAAGWVRICKDCHLELYGEDKEKK